MQRRIWLLAGLAAAVLVVATSATATSKPAAGTVAPFAESWANVPRTPAARKAKDIVVVAMEQDLSGTWNTQQADSTLAWAVWAGINPILRAPYVLDNKYNYVPDLATKVTVNKKSISYTIRKNAFWNWGGKKLPVTYKDFVYTWQAITNPNNNAASRVGLNQIARYTHKGDKQVTFYWKTTGCTSDAPCGPFADYRDLFGFIFPSAALKGLDFDTMWDKCICGSDGKFVTDGPYYMTNYTHGQGVTLKANPMWYGKKPTIKEVDFKLITDTNSEVQAIRSGEVDAAAPQPSTALASLRTAPGVTYKVAAGNYLEHVDLQFGKKLTNPLMRSPWMRQALMMGMDRAGLIKAVFGTIAPGLKPLDSLVVFQSDKRYRGFFKKWNYNPAKALALLKKHCTGGPSTPTNGNTNYFTCSGYPAKFNFTALAGNSRRETSAAIFKANLAAIGVQLDVKLLPSDVFFGDNWTSGNWDMMEFAWGGAVDPGTFGEIWGCGGSQNMLAFCDRKVNKQFDDAKTQLNVPKRSQDFVNADQLLSNSLPSIPLYALPDIVTYKNGLQNVVNNPAAGFTWNIESWKWK